MALLFATSPAFADSITKIGAGGLVDASSMTTTVDVLPGDFTGPGTILDVNVTVDLTKLDWPGDSSWPNEIVLSLISPANTEVSLVAAGTFGANYPEVSAEITFDDGAAPLGAFPQTGTFDPVGSLSDFNGENAQGTWGLYFGDTAFWDPLEVHSWTLNIMTEDQVIQITGPPTTGQPPAGPRDPNAPHPEPGTMALVAGVLAAAVIRRRRKQ